MTLRIDISGLPSGRLRFAASPLAELTAMLHVLAEPGHHPRLAAWAADVWAGQRPELAERLREAEFLWRSSRADFLVPARPRPSLAEELDDVDRIDDETYVTAALVTTCGSNRVRFGAPSPLADATARERALDLAQARGALQEAFAERLLADPAAVRARVRHTLEQCAEAFFDAAWAGVAVRLATDLRLKHDLLKRQGIGAALASVSGGESLDPAVTRGGREGVPAGGADAEQADAVRIDVAPAGEEGDGGLEVLDALRGVLQAARFAAALALVGRVVGERGEPLSARSRA
ncbi:DUF5937 family protein [Sphaerisporangium rhizosphaerae]|uniref:DUF5937 family protein n=1 Tax=Sphaerisporangium rhizosphaerae TaxID=2269375 RepID=A0ABW2P9A1_9ACTN